MIEPLNEQPDTTVLLTNKGDLPRQVYFTWPYDGSRFGMDQSQVLHVILDLAADKQRCILTGQDLSGSLNSTFDEIAAQHGLVPVNLDQPLALDTVAIPKPWGQEIWYTGIESRGVCSIQGTPLPWLIDVFGSTLGVTGAPLLLKILDPFPVENIGDLYFELHDQKVEVYVVTHVDEYVWPDGVGKIRYGFSEEKRSEFDSDKAFLTAYRASVDAYQEIRQTIDALLVEAKARRGLVASDSILPEDYAHDLAFVPEEFRDREQTLRKAMYEFTHLKNLNVGDVVTVKPGFPHSLQHGVRVIEFQTPHYERYILSFGQQVLTQDHWDTETALKQVLLSTPEDSAGDSDLIADFEEFSVRRVILDPGQTVELETASYKLLIGVLGEFEIKCGPGIQTVKGEQAVMLPAHLLTCTLGNTSDQQTSLLIAEEH